MKETTRIKIILCTAVGKQFANLIPNSEHNIIDAPIGHDNEKGVWVMGAGNPVKVLHSEYTRIK